MKYSSRQQPTTHWLRKIDWILIALIMILAIISVTTISSAMSGGQYSANFGIRQIIYYILGAILALIVMIFSPKKIKNNTYIWYIFFCILLLGLLIIPETPITPIINGAKSWYAFGPISIQPSEFMKIILILALAKIVSNHNRFTFNKSFRTDLILFFKIIGISLVPMILILLQNDLGTTLVLCAIIVGVMLVSSITWRILAPIFITVAVLGSSIILAIIYKPSLIEKTLHIKMYQMGRINS